VEKQGFTELLTQKNWHNWSVLMEGVCINNKLLSKEAVLVMPLALFLCNYNNRVGLPGWELKMQSTGESKRKCWHRLKGMIPILPPKLQHEMQPFLSLAFNLSTALHTLLNRQAREVGESSPWGD